MNSARQGPRGGGAEERQVGRASEIPGNSEEEDVLFMLGSLAVGSVSYR